MVMQAVPQPPDYGAMLAAPGEQFAAQQNAAANQLNAQTNTVDTAARIPLLQAQTQGAQLQNQGAALTIQARQRFMDIANAAATDAQNGGSPPPASAPSTDDPNSLLDPGVIAQHVQAKYYVNPAPTQKEAALMMTAAASGDPGLEQAAGLNWKNRVAQQTALSQKNATADAELTRAIGTAPPGTALTHLDFAHPDAAAQVRALAEEYGWTPEQTDDFVRRGALTTFPFLYDASGRATHIGDKDGVTYDDKNRPVLDANGNPLKQGMTIEQEQQALTEQRGQNISAGTAGSAMPLPPTAIIGGSRPPIPAAPGGNIVGAGMPSPAPRARVPGSPAPSSGADNGMLPGVDVTKFPAAPIQTPADAKAVNAAKYSALSDSNTAAAADQKESALIRAAQTEAANLANNPRMTGPGSEAAQAWSKFKTFVSGQPPDELVDQGELDKLLLQMGAQNIRGALSGQRITNQEFMTLMTKGNPNTEMPLPTIRRLLGYLATQNDYDQRFQRTKQAALSAGANPTTIDTAIGGIADRGDYVQSRTGVRPGITAPGGSPSPNTQAVPDAGGFIPGKRYTDKNGNSAIYSGNGKWQ